MVVSNCCRWFVFVGSSVLVSFRFSVGLVGVILVMYGCRVSIGLVLSFGSPRFCFVIVGVSGFYFVSVWFVSGLPWPSPFSRCWALNLLLSVCLKKKCLLVRGRPQPTNHHLP